MESEQFQMLANIDHKVGEVKEKLHNIEIVQTRIESDLKYHIRRTDMLEDRVMLIDEKLKPVENFKGFAMFTAKAAAFVSAVAMAVFSVAKLFAKD